MGESNDRLRLFLRNDDVGKLKPELRAFIDVFESRRLPVSYQIIPSAFTVECAQFLRDRKREAPGLFEFGQHGLTHEMTLGSRTVYYEFGPERSYDEQLEVIRAGKAILAERLGEDFNPRLFTPPRHRYNRDTLKALKACGFEILSASSYPSFAHHAAYGLGRALGLTNLGRPGVPYHGRTRPDCGLFELSISVPVDDGWVSVSQPAEAMAMIEKARRRTDVVGLMFHHRAYASEAGRAFLTELADRLVALPGASFHLLSDLHRSLAGEDLQPAAA